METKKIRVLFNNIKDNSNSQFEPKTYDEGIYEVPVEVADDLLSREVAELSLENKKLSVKYKKKAKKKS